CQGNRQTNSAPKRVTTANPIPKLKHVLFVDAELDYFLFICGKSCKMFGDMFFVFCLSQEPVPRSMCVRHRFLCCKCFGRNEKLSLLWFDFFECFRNMSSVNVGNEICLNIFYPIRSQSFSHHQWTEFATTNANIHDVLDFFACVAAPFSCMNF